MPCRCRSISKAVRSPGFVRFLIFHTLTCVLAVALGAAPAESSGFALFEQSPSLAGTAYAGAGSRALDASTIFFNPAGMSRLDSDELVVGAHVVLTDITFEGAAVLDPDHPLLPAPLAGLPTPGAPVADGSHESGVPNLFWTHVLSDRWRLGVGLSTPFGLVTDYGPEWVGRYHAVRSELVTLNLNPSFAYRLRPGLSVGGGVNLLYADARLSQAIDFGLLGAFAGLPGATPGDPALDGLANTEADDWGVGWNLGLLLELPTGTRFGLSFRSEIDLDFSGDATFRVPAAAAPLTAGGAFVATPATTSVTLPSSVNGSVTFKLPERWTLLVDVSWTGWSRLQELVIAFENPAQPASTTDLGWDDTWRFAGGAAWRASEALELRFGAAFDEGASDDPMLRTPRIPDADRLWLTVGLGYEIGGLDLDFAYAHIAGDDVAIDAGDAASGAVPGFHRLQGTFDASADVLSVQARWRFGTGG